MKQTEGKKMEQNWLKTIRYLAIEMDSSDTTILNLIDPEQFDAPEASLF